jgi:hypothetical protein
MFWKLDVFTSSGDWKEIPTLLGPLQRANLNHGEVSCFWETQQSRCLPPLPSPEVSEM